MSADRIRVVQIGPVPPPHGGVATNMLAIHDALIRSGHESLIIDVTNKGGIAAASDNLLKPRSSFHLLRMLLSLDSDIVHYHIGGEYRIRLVLLTLLCGILPRKRSVLTFHSGGFARAAVGSARPSSLRGLALRSIDLLICVNEQMKDMFRSFGVAENRIRLILPFELKKADPRVRVPRELEDFLGSAEPFLLSVGALEKEYGNEFLIRAMPRLLKEFPNARLVVVGSGSLQTSLEEVSRSLGLESRICLTGNLDHAVVLRLIEKASVLIRLTDYDGDSIAIREALFHGTPAVASDNAIRPHGVCLVPSPFTEEGLLKAVNKALELQFSVQSDTGVEDNAAKVLEVYQELIGR